MITLAYRFNEKVEKLAPAYRKEMTVTPRTNTSLRIMDRMKPHGEYVEGMAAVILTLIENEDG